MVLGIRPIVDFAFKKIFGTPENRIALISLLNAILNLKSPIVDVTLKNPYNLKDFEDDKLSILDIKAVDQSGRIYGIEIQLSGFKSLVQRIAFYGFELYNAQLAEADQYWQLQPVFSICLLNGILWKDATKVHHAFRLTDQESGRVLENIIAIHTLELGRYNLTEADLADASTLDCWLFWLLHAQEYDLEALLKLFPQQAFRQATEAIARIAQKTEDKAMYDSREKAIRDRNWELGAAHREGMIEGEIKGKLEMIRTLQSLLRVPVMSDEDLRAMPRDQLESLKNSLQEQLRSRMPA